MEMDHTLVEASQLKPPSNLMLCMIKGLLNYFIRSSVDTCLVTLPPLLNKEPRGSKYSNSRVLGPKIHTLPLELLMRKASLQREMEPLGSV